MLKKSTAEFMLVSSFDIHLLEEAFLENRLYIKPKAEGISEETIREEGIQSILQYVSHIDESVSEKFISFGSKFFVRLS